MTNLIRTVVDNEHGLVLRKYTKRVFYKGLWNDETINARGHVTDLDGNPVATPFKKFFNVGEHETTSRENVLDRLKNDADIMFRDKKWNGHLSICYMHHGVMKNHTAGTFNHEFNVDDERIIRSMGYSEDNIPQGTTLMFEIIGLHDKHLMTDTHIAELGGECAVLLGATDENGEPIPREDYMTYFMSTGVTNLKAFGERVRISDELDQLSMFPETYLDLLFAQENTEGYILICPLDNWRVKVKTSWFIRNRYLRQFNHLKTSKIFIEHFDTGKAFDVIPEELYDNYRNICKVYKMMQSENQYLSLTDFTQTFDMSLV